MNKDRSRKGQRSPICCSWACRDAANTKESGPGQHGRREKL